MRFLLDRARAARHWFATMAGAGLVVAACGGDTDAVGGGGSNAGSGGSDASGKGGTGAESSAGGSGGSSITDASGGTATGGSAGSTTGGSGGSTTDGSGGSATGGRDGSTTPGAGTVVCLGVGGPARECALGEYCCGQSCTSTDLPCSGAAIRCDEAADCPDAFCCMTKISRRDGGSQNARCRASCDTESELIMCKYADADTVCPAGMRCEITATLPPLYGYCCTPGTLCPTT